MGFKLLLLPSLCLARAAYSPILIPINMPQLSPLKPPGLYKTGGSGLFSALAQRFTPPQANARSLSILDRFRSLRLLRWKYRLSGWKAQGKPLAELPPADQQLVKTLQRQGGAQTSLAALGLPLTPDLFQAAQTLAGQLPSSAAHSNSHLGHCIHGDAATIVQRYPEILLWGLQERLLDIVENYMQLPVAYLGVDLRKDIPNGEQVGTRFWHTDGEDVCVVKIAVYLNDVGQAQGPFEYISKTEFNASYRYLSPTYLSKNLRRPCVTISICPKLCLASAGQAVLAQAVR